jgi:hypothetical protein
MRLNFQVIKPYEGRGCIMSLEIYNLLTQLQISHLTRFFPIMRFNKYSMSQNSWLDFTPSCSMDLTPLNLYFWGYV